MLISDHWFVYLLRCRGGRLYTGITTDPSRRLAEHARGRGSRSLRGRQPLVLVYCALAGDRSRALRLEHAIKRLKRPEKEALVAGVIRLGGLLTDPGDDGAGL